LLILTWRLRTAASTRLRISSSELASTMTSKRFTSDWLVFTSSQRSSR
jgi:hypothetical protein